MYILYRLFVHLFDLYAQIIVFFQTFTRKYLVGDSYTFFQISKVYCPSSTLNFTYNFNKNINFDYVYDGVLCFEWTFDNINYKQYLSKESFQFLAPYSIFNMRYKSPDNKIIACLITNKDTNEIENLTSTIKQMAGPKQNFFKGLYNIHTIDIFGLQNKILQIITTNTTCYFDLSKDNILEL